MNEDLHPLYDIESNWIYSRGEDNIQVFEHKEYKQLLRVINFKDESIIFTDRMRVTPARVIDINKGKLLTLKRKAELMTLIIRVIDAEKPIKMPYVPEELKVYIEDLGEYVGVLYYMDSDEKKTVIPIKRYWKHDTGLIFKEVSQDEYVKVRMKEEFTNVNNGSDKADNS